MLPVLMYHGVHVDERSPGRFDPVYSIAPSEFVAQLDWLLKQGYRTSRFIDWARNGVDEKRVMITFDDGDVSNIEMALPLLVERGMCAEFFVTSDFIDEPGMLSAGHLRALVDAGMGVQSHGQSHRYLSDLSAAELETELSCSKQHLEACAGQRVDALALPGGRGGERERVAALKAGYRHVLNSAPGTNRVCSEGEYLQRISIRRGLGLAEFAAMVQWRGLKPRLGTLRYHALALTKRWLGNRGYERIRSRLLRQ